MPKVKKCSRMVTLPEPASTHKVIWPYNHVVLRDHVTNLHHYISTTTMFVATKLGRVGIYNEEVPFINSHNPLIRCSRKVTWNITYVIFLLQQFLWPPNLAGLLHSMRSFPPQSQTTCYHGLARWYDKLNVLYLRYHNYYGYQTWQIGCIQWRTPFNKAIKSLGLVSCKITWQIKYFISLLL